MRQRRCQVCVRVQRAAHRRCCVGGGRLKRTKNPRPRTHTPCPAPDTRHSRQARVHQAGSCAQVKKGAAEGAVPRRVVLESVGHTSPTPAAQRAHFFPLPRTQATSTPPIHLRAQHPAPTLHRLPKAHTPCAPASTAGLVALACSGDVDSTAPMQASALGSSAFFSGGAFKINVWGFPSRCHTGSGFSQQIALHPYAPSHPITRLPGNQHEL